MFYRVISTHFEDIEEAHQIGLNICRRILYRVPYSGLGSQINDHVKGVSFKYAFQKGTVRNIAPNELESSGAIGAFDHV